MAQALNSNFASRSPDLINRGGPAALFRSSNYNHTTTRISTLALSLQSAIYTRYVYKHIALSAGVCLYNINLPAASKPPPLQVKSDSRLHTFAWDGLGTGYFTPLRCIFTNIPIHSSNLPLGPHPINWNSSDSTHLYTGRMESGSSTCTMLKRSVLTLAYC